MNASKRSFGIVVAVTVAIQFAIVLVLLNYRVAITVTTIPVALLVFAIRGWPIARKPIISLIKKTSAESIYQLQGYGSLAAFLGNERPLPLLTGWTLSADNTQELVRIVVDKRPRIIVELGSGSSTVILATLLRKIGSEAKIYSVDHDPLFAAYTRERLMESGLDSFATVIDAPLCPIEDPKFDHCTDWYDIKALQQLPDEIDLLLVDGPPGRSGDQARYPALPVLRDRLAKNAIVLLDDAKRTKESNVFKRWLEENEDFDGRILKTSHGLGIILRRPNDR